MRKETTIPYPNGRQIISYALVKCAKELWHLEKILEEGELYLNTMKYFREGDGSDNNFVMDEYEGATYYMKVGPGTMSANIYGKNITLPIIKFEANKNIQYMDGNICSFYGITNELFEADEMKPVDQRMEAEYSYFIFITDYQEFTRRLKEAFNRVQINCRYGLVDYFDEDNYMGPLHSHSKRSRYAFQNEYRIFLDTDGLKPMYLKIGSLKDIAQIHPISRLSGLRATISTNKDYIQFTQHG